MTTFVTHKCCRGHIPIITPALFALIIVIFYTNPHSILEFAYSPTNPWYTPLTYAFVHDDSTHLWQNALVLVLYGLLFEATENAAQALLVVAASIPVAAGGHALFSDRPVVGSSGFIYGLLSYQLALLAKNWREMKPHYYEHRALDSCVSFSVSRVMYLVYALGLLAMELYISMNSTNISHTGHTFGAVAGVSVGLVIGSNLKYDRGEVLLVLLGFVSYVLLSIVFLSDSQLYVALWTLVAAAPLAPYTVNEIRGRCRTH